MMYLSRLQARYCSSTAAANWGQYTVSVLEGVCYMLQMRSAAAAAGAGWQQKQLLGQPLAATAHLRGREGGRQTMTMAPLAHRVSPEAGQ